MFRHWLRRVRPTPAGRVAPQAEWVEPRLLYSADAASLLGVDTALAPAAEQRTLDASFEYTATAAETAATPADVRTAYALTPLQFEADAGQLGEGVDFAASGLGYAVRLGAGGQAELLLPGAQDPVRLELVDSQGGVASGQDLLPTRSNYLVGADSSKWVTDIANYGSVLYRGVYDGIDVRYYGNQDQLEYDFLLAPGADASKLQLAFHGVDDLHVDANGDLVLRVAGTGRDIRFQAPVSWQDGAAGRTAVESHYALQADGTVRIAVGDYDHSRALVVDPVLSHATYLGEAATETGVAVAIGGDGSVYVTGQTASTTGAFATRLASGSDNSESYVAKFNADLTTLVYATRVGGSAADEGHAIAVDASGNAIVTGLTKSSDFLVTAGADQPVAAAGVEAFLYKLNAAGNGLVFGTYFGAGKNDAGNAVAVDAGGNIYVAGTLGGSSDNAFLNKYTAAGAAVYKLQYGGGNNDSANGIALDAAGNVYIAGDTLSTDNVTLNGAQATRPGVQDGFLAKYDSSGTLVYATYIGSDKDDWATAVAADDSGRAYVVGRTKDPTALATTAGAFATTTASLHQTGYLRIYDTTQSGAASLAYSTLLGGSKDSSGKLSTAIVDSPTGVAVHGGQVAIVGHSDSSDFPTTTDAYSATNTSGDTGFLLVLTPQSGGGNDIVYGSYYGTGLTTGGVAWSGSKVYLVGSTNTSSGIATSDGYRSTYNGGGDAVVAVFSGFTNVAPVLSGTAGLAGQLEDVAAPGTLVSDLVAGRIADADTGALPGIAITAADSTKGSWQYTLDGGANWTTFTTPAADNALLLNADAGTRVRFVGALDYAGSSSITFRAWDRSTGTAGTTVAVPRTGGGSAFSNAQATASVTVTAVNDAPVRSAGSLNPITVAEGSATVSLGLGSLAYGVGGGSDEASQALSYVVTALPGSVGTIQLASGTPVVLGSTYSLADVQGMKFLAGRTGTATFTFAVKDDGGTADGGQDSLSQSVSLTVTNLAPVLTASSVPMPTQLEDVPGNGTRVQDFLTGYVSDGGGAWGLVVAQLPGGNIHGTWQYSLDDGATFNPIVVSSGNYLMLGNDARVRFAPDANFNGTVPGFTFYAWDGSNGVASGSYTGSASIGGTTPYSSTSATVTLTVAPVNDAPVRVNATNGAPASAPPDVTVNEESAATSLGLGSYAYAAGPTADEYNVQGVTITVTGLPSAIGTVKYYDSATATWVAVAANTTYTLAQLQGMTFTPTTGLQTGSGVLTWTVKDNGGTANGGVDTLADQVRINIQNIAPTLTGYVPFAAISEDAQSTGVLVSALISGKESDPSGNTGIAVTQAVGVAGGTWQWSKDGGSIWNSLADASTTNAYLLQTGGQWRVRYLPGANWNNTIGGGTPSITFRGWDRSTGTAGSTADASVTGGTSAFSGGSSQTASIGVTAVNDAPVATGLPTTPLAVLDGAPRTSLGLGSLAFGPGGGSDEAGQTTGPTYVVTGVPSTLGAVYLANNGAQVTAGTAYTLAQLRGMEFLANTAGLLGAEYLTFTVTDNGGTANGGVDTSTFSVKIIVNHAPTLNGANSPVSVLEDFGGSGNPVNGQVPSWATPAQRAGGAVADIVSGQISDNNTTQGIAIIGKTGSGTWQYTLDGGTTWTNMAALSNSTALLLPSDGTNARVRFIPDADFNSNIGTAGITFRAWDQTSGIAGQLGDATYNGGATAYSVATATSFVTVTPVNDAPAALNTPTGGSVVEGAAPAAMLVSGTYGPGPVTATDEAAQNITVTFPSGVPAGVSLFLADGVTPVNAAGTYTLAQFLGMTFASGTSATPGSYQLSFRLQDDGGVANGGVDNATLSLTLTVTNKAPVLYGANAMTGIVEDTPGNGTLVADLISGQVADPTAARGIAVTTVDNSNGSWQYTLDGGGTWNSIGTPSATSARLLPGDANTRLRFVPAANWNGSASFSFAAWDGTTGTAGGVGNTTVNGTTTAFSTTSATSTIAVAAVNDAPVGGTVANLTVREDSGSTSLALAGIGYGPGGGADESGQTLSYTVAALPAASFGRITLADGTNVTLGEYTIDQVRGMRFVAATNANGTDAFTFNVRDNGGGTDTLAQALAITITPVNDPPVAGFDMLTGTEDTPVTLLPSDLLANDSDVDGDALTISGVAPGSGGTVALVNGNVVFTPDADFNGMATFSYTVADGKGGTSITGAVINLAPVNDAPVARADVVSGTEDQPLTLDPATLLGNDSDVEGDVLSVTGVTSGAGGTVALSNGSIVFTPNLDFNGPASFTYTVDDGQGGTATGTVTVNVAAVNDAPVARADTTADTAEDTQLTIAPADLLGNDSDVDGDTLAVSAVANGTGGTVQLVNGSIVFTPTADFNGAARFGYTVSDGHGGTANAVATVNVTAVNDAPVANAEGYTATANVPLTIPASDLVANDTDADGDTLSVTSVSAAAHGTVTLSNGNIVYTADALYVGGDAFTYTVDDGHGGTATATVNITVLVGNHAPVAAADTVTGTEDTPLAIPASTLLANDTDADLPDTLSITGVAAISGGTVSLSGQTINFFPTGNFNGAARFSYTVSDGNGGTATATVTVNVAAVNDAPVAGADTVSGAEDQAFTIPGSTLLVNDTDPENDTLVITGVTAVSGGTVALSGQDILFTPDANFNGDASFRYTVGDGHDGVATGAVTVSVAAVNDAPVAAADTIAGVEDQPLTIAPGLLLGNDSDVENDTLTVTAVANGTGGTVLLDNGSILFTPTVNYSGPATFSYTVSDGAATTTAVVTVNLDPANDAPVANPDAVSGTEDTDLVLPPATLLVNDTDVDGDAVSISAVSNPVGGTVAIVNGNVVFSPTPDFNGPGSFRYTASDGKGGTSTATVTVDVNAVNDAPVAVADPKVTAEDVQLVLDPSALLGNDSDVDGDALAITGLANGSGGTVQFANGRIVFTPNADFNGAGSFSYTVSDGNGGTSTAQVTVTVTPVNDAPVARADAAQTVEDTQLTIEPGTLLANDSDVDGNLVAISGVTSGTGGTAVLSNGNVVFTPTANFNGTASFSYTVSDGQGGAATASVSVTVTAVNDAPVATTDLVTGTEDTLVVIAPEDLLANDTDAENDTLSITGVSNAVNGTVSVSGTSIVFTPDANFFGAGSFRYTISDGQGGTATGTVNVNVAPANDPPEAHADVVGTAEDTPLTIAPATLLLNDLDLENDALTVTRVGNATGGTVTLNAGSILFTPDRDFNGPATFNYTIADTGGAISEATVTVNVSPVNDAPVATTETLATDEDVPLGIDVATLLLNDTDADGDALTIVGVASNPGGVVELVGSRVTFTPDPDFYGASGFRYTVSDADGATSTVTVTVNVASVDDAPVPGADTAATAEDTPVTIVPATLLTNDTDIEGDPITFTGVANGVGGTVAIVGGDIVFTPTADFNGAGSFTYSVSDGQGGTADGTVVVTVTPVNDAPVAQDAAPATREDAPLVGSVVASDVDSAGLGYALVSGPTHGVLSFAADGSYAYTAAANYFGADSFTFQASDGALESNTATVNITVTAVNDAPAAADSAATTDEDTPVVGSVAATDVDSGSLTYAIVSGPSHGVLTFGADGSYTYTAGANYFGADSFSFKANDGALDSNVGTVSISVAAVNDAPVAQDAAVTTNEDTPLVASVAASDVDGGSLTYTVVTGPAHGVLSFAADGSYTYTAAANYFGADSFGFKANDGALDSSVGTVSISVAAANDAPVAQDATATTNEDTPLVASVTATDVDTGSLTYTVVSGPNHGALTFAADGSYTYTAAANYFGADSFSFKANDGALDSNIATVSIAVASVNDAPVAQDSAVTTNEDTPLVAGVTATDVDSGLAYVLVTGPAHGALTFNTDGSYTYTGAANYVGADTFTFKANDGTLDSNVGTVSIAVAAVNDAPVAQDATATTNEDTPLVASVTATDVDTGSLTYTVVSGPSHGVLTFAADGSYTYTAAANYFGADRFDFQASDGALNSSPATVSITVRAVNDAPIAQDGSATTDEDTPLVGSVAASDVDNASLAYVLVSGPSHGALTFGADGSYTYTPGSNYFGADSFSFQASDGSLVSAVATLHLGVAAVDDPTNAGADSVTVAEDSPAAGNVLANDSDADDALTVASFRITGDTTAHAAGASVAIAGQGTFTLGANGAFTFTPLANWNGPVAQVSYTTNTGASSTLAITVTPVDDATTPAADAVTIAEDAAAAGNVLANDADLDNVQAVAGFRIAGDSTAYAAGATVNLAGQGTFTLAADGTFTFTPVANWNGSLPTVSYTTDTGASSTLSITVTPVDDPTVTAADSFTVAEDNAAAGNVLSNDSDVDDALAVTSFRVAGDATTYAAGATATLAGQGTITLGADGAFTFTPEANWNGATPLVSYTTSTGAAGTLAISVTSVDDPTVANADSATVAEDGAAAGNVLANDSDVDSVLAVASFQLAGDETIYAAGATATTWEGTLTVDADGTFTFTPLANWNGSVPVVSYTTSTGASSTLSMAVTAVDDASVALGDAATIAEDGIATGNVLANDSDVDSALAVSSFSVGGDATVYRAGDSANVTGRGTVTIAADGSFRFTPLPDWNGAVPAISYTTGTGATQTLIIAVTAVNDAPVASGRPADLMVTEGATASLGLRDISYGVGGGADEASTQQLTVTVTALPDKVGAITLADGTSVVAGGSYSVAQLQGMVFHAAAGASGGATLEFMLSDGAGGEDTIVQQLAISVANQAPVLDGANDLRAIAEDATDNGGMLVADLVAGHAKDPGGPVGIAVTGADSADGQWQYSLDGVKWSSFDAVSGSSAQLLTADARVRFVPAADWNGTATGLVFRAWDLSGGTARADRADTSVNGGTSAFSAGSATASVNVQAINDAPEAASSVAPVQGIEASPGSAVVLSGVSFEYSPGGGSDEATQSVTVTVTSVPAADVGRLVLADGTAVVAGGSYTTAQLRGLQFIPAAGSDGRTAEVDWVVRDDGGTAAGGSDQAAGSVRIAVTLPPVAPVLPPPAPLAQAPAPAPAPASAPAPAPAPAQAAPAATVSVRPGGAPAAAGDALLDASAAPPLVQAPPTVVALERAADAPAQTRAMGAGARASLADLQLVAFNPQTTAEFQVTGLASLGLPGIRVTTEAFQQSMRSGLFIEQLNQLRDQLREQFDLDRTVSMSVAGVSLGVSVVYVLWLVRGGVLLGSYLSALPAWRLLDPLPVLARPGEDVDEDDETFDREPGRGADPLRGFS